MPYEDNLFYAAVKGLEQEEEGYPQDIFSNPKTPQPQQFLKSIL